MCAACGHPNAFPQSIKYTHYVDCALHNIIYVATPYAVTKLMLCIFKQTTTFSMPINNLTMHTHIAMYVAKLTLMLALIHIQVQQ